MSDVNEEVTLTIEEVASLRQGYKFCPRCGRPMVDGKVYGRIRRVCSDPTCKFVQFIDPKVGSAVLAVDEANRVLLVKRGVDPGRGGWCMPGGFIEQGETPQAAAIRECLEESGLVVEITQLIDVYYYENFRGSGLLIIYKGRIAEGNPQPGDDAVEVGFFEGDDLPENLAFASNVQALTAWREGKV
jgi:ADP-ribose pyrophosphatase YjhB (NUDIX family)